MRTIIIWIFVVCFILVVVLIYVNKEPTLPENQNLFNPSQVASEKNELPIQKEINVKEFSMTSFLAMDGNQPRPQFSVKEITVKKGDTVRIKIKATSGMHDFKIDEFNVYADTPINKEVVVSFVTDRSGQFVYYCTKPGHRQNGHFGTLTVID